VLYDAYARASASSDLCTSSIGGNETTGEYGALSHISTTSVAPDMLEILHKTGDKTGQKKLRYWGFSYGTMLGGMFAAMYSDKVERMVNDGESRPSSSEELEPQAHNLLKETSTTKNGQHAPTPTSSTKRTT
jgi:pimeloyl-ACP methyl ester carboxylesterase